MGERMSSNFFFSSGSWSLKNVKCQQCLSCCKILPVPSNMESSIEDKSPPQFQTSQDLAQITSQLSNESKMDFFVCGWLLYGCVIVKVRQRWNYNICFPGIWFSARVDATEAAQTLKSIESERVFGWYSRREWVKRVCQPLHSRWPPRAFISETWEEAENGGPGVLYADKLSPGLAARRLPSTLLTSISSHLYLCPLCASSNSLNFLSEAGV